MFLPTLFLAQLVTLDLSMSLLLDDAKPKPEEKTSYVKVEIKGTLDTKGTAEAIWKSIEKGSSTGVRILTDGLHSRDPWPELKNGEGLTFVQWELFLGEDKALKELAKDLKGKSVVARGTVTILYQSRGWRFQPTTRLVVRVSSLEQAAPQK
ncbi:MAG TPA: hypothetical protein VKE94_05995 [Gemmataceae bacterium]|nr:hypothetical protein [Gemmataceae bacterium]